MVIMCSVVVPESPSRGSRGLLNARPGARGRPPAPQRQDAAPLGHRCRGLVEQREGREEVRGAPGGGAGTSLSARPVDLKIVVLVGWGAAEWVRDVLTELNTFL